MNTATQTVGTLVVYVTMGYKKPGESAISIWTKLVTLHTEHHVTIEQAQQVLNRWKEVNKDCVGKFSAAMY